eukprot:1763797-Rhodomonas_salina.6
MDPALHHSLQNSPTCRILQPRRLDTILHEQAVSNSTDAHLHLFVPEPNALSVLGVLNADPHHAQLDSEIRPHSCQCQRKASPCPRANLKA